MRKTSTRHLVISLITLGLLTCVAHFTIHVGMHRIRTGPYGAFNRVDRGEVNSEVVVLGSSRAALHYDPDVMTELTRLSTFNLGRVGSRSEVYAGVLGHYLHHNRRPRLILLNADYNSCDANTELYDPVQFTPYLGDEALFRALLSRHPRVWAMRYVPLYGYISNDVEFRHYLGLDALVGRQPWETYRNGYVTSDREFDDRRLGDTMERKEFFYSRDDEGCSDFARSLDVAKSLGIPSIVVFSPIYNGLSRRVRDREGLLGQFAQVANSRGAEFWDFSSAPAIADNQFYFGDSVHMNTRGAKLFSQLLGKRLAEWLPKHGIQATGR